MVLAGVGYLRGLQDTKRPLYVAAGTAVLNLVIEVVLIYGFDQGIGASALSTVLAQWVGAGVYCWWIARAVARHGVGLRPDWRIIGRLAGAGVDLLMRTPLVADHRHRSRPASGRPTWRPMRSPSRSGVCWPCRSTRWRSQPRP